MQNIPCELGLYLYSDDMFSKYAQKTYMENIPCELALRNRAGSICFFSISFGQSEESSNEVNCFFTDNARQVYDNAKILISEL